jgi:hypothetical protein
MGVVQVRQRHLEGGGNTAPEGKKHHRNGNCKFPVHGIYPHNLTSIHPSLPDKRQLHLKIHT